ncbi:fibroblast growth factor receptor 4-like [Branchiostoma floridae x Branchiostoma belcheri]
MNVNLTVPVVLFLLLCLNIFLPTKSACRHSIRKPRGHIWSITNVTSDHWHCEWDIRFFPFKIILINFDSSGYRRGSENCTADLLTFHDGNSPTSRTIDTFCGDQTPSTDIDDTGRLLDLSTASTGHQMYITYTRNLLSPHRSEFNLTFTTRDNNYVPEFNEETFVPQTAPVFNNITAKDFVQVTIEPFGPNNPFFFPYGYKTNTRTGDVLQLYVTIQDYVFTSSDLASDLGYTCTYTSDGSTVSALLTVPTDSNWSPEDWPWVPARLRVDAPSFGSTEGVFIYTISGVTLQVGESTTVECKVSGLVAFRTNIRVTACPIGRFGRFCAERCQCYNGAACHSFNGACRCAPGWAGRNCTTVHPEMHISPPARELTDLRIGQELQLTCTAYQLDVTDITWLLQSGIPVEQLNVSNSKNSSVLYINSLAPKHEGNVTCVGLTTSGDTYTDVVGIRIVCEENYWGELCDDICNCTDQETCNRAQGCICDGDGCSDLPPPDSQTGLLAISLSSGGLILLLLGVIFLLYRHNNRLRVGNIDDPEVFQLGKDLKAVMPPAAGSSTGSIDMELLKEREIDRSRLQGGQLLGEGAFGHVVKATLTRPEEDDVVVAVKKLKDDGDPQARQTLLRETCIMLLCGNHDNVLGLKGICFRDGPLQLVLEYAEHGSLLHLLWTLRAESKLNRTVLVNKRHIFENMMVEVCCGLEHLATMRLVHRDIAARNILICGKGTAKIADFGLARDMYAVGYHRQDRGHDLLPLKWMAPEGLKNEARFTHKSDVWSFGVLLWEVAQLGRTPYPGMEGADRIYDALQNHFRLPRPQLCTEERYQLMLKCWKFNEKTRPDATTVRKLLVADPNGFFYFNAPVAAIEAPVTPV